MEHEFGAGFYKKLLDELADGVYFVDMDRRITYWNNGAERITGYAKDRAVGTFCRDNLLNHVTSEGTELCRGMCPLAETLKDGQPREADVFLHHRDGHRVPVAVRISTLRDDTGQIIGAVETFSEATSKLSALRRVEELEEIALLCPLTNVGNRRFTESFIVEKLEELNRYGWPFGLLMLDVDHFKTFNDTYGHNVGDQVLKMVSQSLSAHLRAFDFVGRWGGEEFVVVLPNVTRDTLHDLADRCRALVAQSGLDHESGRLAVTVSIGAALARQGDRVEDLIQRADDLMYISKQSGRNRVTIED